MFIRLVLPAPFSPSRPSTSPAATRRSTPSQALTDPKRLVMPRMATSGTDAIPLGAISGPLLGPRRGLDDRHAEVAGQDLLPPLHHQRLHIRRQLLLPAMQRRQVGAALGHEGEAAEVLRGVDAGL